MVPLAPVKPTINRLAKSLPPLQATGIIVAKSAVADYSSLYFSSAIFKSSSQARCVHIHGLNFWPHHRSLVGVGWWIRKRSPWPSSDLRFSHSKSRPGPRFSRPISSNTVAPTSHRRQYLERWPPFVSTARAVHIHEPTA